MCADRGKILSGIASSRARLRRSARLQREEVLIALDLEANGSCDLFEQLGLFEERVVVHDRGERATVPLDQRDETAGLGDGLAGPAVDVDVAAFRLGARRTGARRSGHGGAL